MARGRDGALTPLRKPSQPQSDCYVRALASREPTRGATGSRGCPGHVATPGQDGPRWLQCSLLSRTPYESPLDLLERPLKAVGAENGEPVDDVQGG